MPNDLHLLSRRSDALQARAPMVTPLPMEISAGVRTVMHQVERMAQSDAPVLIQGETGSGKEAAARAIWSRSRRRTGPFIPVNCGAIPDGLIETEFFGHSAGAFTDARQARDGVIALAQHGTLFLDEIHTLSPRAQVILLRFLQDLRYRPVGAAAERAADVRVIAASNQPLKAMADNGSFRRDLLYRLNILEVTIPPQVLLADGDEIGAGQPPAQPGHDALAAADAPLKFRAAKARALAEFERTYASQMLAAANGSVSLAARMAGKERRSFGKLLKKHGIDRLCFRH